MCADWSTPEHAGSFREVLALNMGIAKDLEKTPVELQSHDGRRSTGRIDELTSRYVAIRVRVPGD